MQMVPPRTPGITGLSIPFSFACNAPRLSGSGAPSPSMPRSGPSIQSMNPSRHSFPVSARDKTCNPSPVAAARKNPTPSEQRILHRVSRRGKDRRCRNVPAQRQGDRFRHRMGASRASERHVTDRASCTGFRGTSRHEPPLWRAGMILRRRYTYVRTGLPIRTSSKQARIYDL